MQGQSLDSCYPRTLLVVTVYVLSSILFFLIAGLKNGRGGSCSFVGSLVQLVSLILKVTMSLTRKTLNCYNSSNFNILINHITNHLVGASEIDSNLLIF